MFEREIFSSPMIVVGPAERNTDVISRPACEGRRIEKPDRNLVIESGCIAIALDEVEENRETTNGRPARVRIRHASSSDLLDTLQVVAVAARPVERLFARQRERFSVDAEQD